MSGDKDTKRSHRKTPPGKQKRRSTLETGEDSCRCKEVAKKTPKELLKVAIDDLSFWKKFRNR